MNTKIKEFFEEKTKNKDINFEDFLLKLSTSSISLTLTSHVPKFTHPDAKSNFINNNINYNKLDIYGNNYANTAYKFLFIKIDDKTIYEHLKLNTDTIKNELGFDEKSYNIIRNNFLKIESNEIYTDSKVKQIYFPTNNSYNLLSVITPSYNIDYLNNKIKDIKFSEKTKEIKKLKNDNIESKESFDDLYNLTLIGYGGSKPQNISYKNNANGGKFYLLESLPPSFKNKYVKMPNRDFFSESLNYDFRYILNSFNTLLNNDKNNYNIKQHRDNILNKMFDKFVFEVYKTREEIKKINKDRYKKLKLNHKILIDDKYSDKRDSEWLQEIIKDFTRWIIIHNKKQKNDFILGDTEFNYIEKHFIKNGDILY